MTMGSLSDLDLSYTPPLSSPWDPIQMAAQAWSQANRRADGGELVYQAPMTDRRACSTTLLPFDMKWMDGHIYRNLE